VSEESRGPAQIQAIKEQRAAQLAKRTTRQTHSDARADRYLMIHLGQERYGLPVGCIERILPLRPITPLPGAPAHVPGAVCLVGEVLTLLDLGQLLGVVREDEAPGAHLVVVDTRGLRVALRVEQVLGVVEVTEVTPWAGDGDSWLKPDQVFGVAGNSPLLDVASLLLDPRLVVDTGDTPRGVDQQQGGS
jgi:purine-binding chemotaxis protein CheW